MPHFRLRTLMIILAVGPLAVALWWSNPGLAAVVCFLGSVIATIAYWPQICGKGG
jgi:hypothetical protein